MSSGSGGGGDAAIGDKSNFTAMMEDAAELCDRRNSPVFTDFLSEEEQVLAQKVMKQFNANYMFYGGYEGAESCMLGVFPPYDEPDGELFPLDAVTARFLYDREITHRDVLGTLMAQGIERDCIGDILIDDDHCVFFCRNTVTSFLLGQIRTIGGVGVALSEGYEAPLPEAHRFLDIAGTIASPRLDCVTALLLRAGRSEAESAIEEGRVSVCGEQCKKTSRTISEGDRITVRGKGKFIIDEIGPETRKGRLMLSARKYV